MAMKYGVFGKGRNGKYQSVIVSHPKCFGSVYRLHEEIQKADVIPDQTRFFCNTRFTKAEFDHWWPRIVKDFPTFKANDRVIKAPRGVYYGADSTKFGSVKGIGPHIVIKFEDDIDNQQMYLIVKFYLKNICMPRDGKSGTNYLWKQAEELLKSAGMPTTMPYIMALNSSASIANTDGYGWPIGIGSVGKKALATFLSGKYEAEISRDISVPGVYDRQWLTEKTVPFDYSSPRNKQVGLSVQTIYKDGRYQYPEGVDLLPSVSGNTQALERLREATK